jgi:hypothetical protein
MSYDLLVFDAAAAPRDREEFLDWYDERTEWEAPHGYDDPQVTTPALRAWFEDMIATYPPLNGPFANHEGDNILASEYSIDGELIYVCFAWSQAERAYDSVVALAGKHGVGFFDASGPTGAVWLPDGNGGLVLAHESSS